MTERVKRKTMIVTGASQGIGAGRVVRNLSIPAEAASRSDLLPLWAGQSANLSTCPNVWAFCNSLVQEVSQIAGPAIQWSANQSRKHSNS